MSFNTASEYLVCENQCVVLRSVSTSFCVVGCTVHYIHNIVVPSPRHYATDTVF